MLLVTTYFPERSHTLLRIILGTTLLMFWMPPLFLLSLAHHTVYFWFPVLMLFLIGIFKLAENAIAPRLWPVYSPITCALTRRRCGWRRCSQR